MAFMVFMGVFSRRGFLDYRRMTNQNSELRRRIEAVTKEKSGMEQQISNFRTDPIEQERIIREKLGYVRKNDLVVEFD